MESRLKVLLSLLVVVLAVLVVVVDGKRRAAEARLSELMVQTGGAEDPNAEANKELAKEIVNKVGELYQLPVEDGEQPTVATIVDVEQLREQNAFYNKAENGDYLILTTTRAVLYRKDEHKIIDVAPVELQEAAPAEQAK